MPYLYIPLVVEKVLNAMPTAAADSIEYILEVDAQTRKAARQYIQTLNL
jgi:1-deoxy-D-xylulose 5-phosphate reductoisomerase